MIAQWNKSPIDVFGTPNGFDASICGYCEEKNGRFYVYIVLEINQNNSTSSYLLKENSRKIFGHVDVDNIESPHLQKQIDKLNGISHKDLIIKAQLYESKGKLLDENWNIFKV